MFTPIRPEQMTKERVEELGRCAASYTYFVQNYCMIYDSVDKQWIPFLLWPDQKQVLRDLHANKQTVILKARQLGISWLTLCYALWEMLFEPIAVVSIFSRREEEAAYLLGKDRLRGIYNNLPAWMKTGHAATKDSVLEWVLENGSVARAFSTKSGDGYVATLVIVDEADLSPDLNTLMRSVKPTIVNGGRMVMLSRSNKQEPESEFKKIYLAAKNKENGWKSVFLPWYSHPGRDDSWYAEQKQEIWSRTGSYDELYEQYPATDAQALSTRELDKRIPPMWIEMVTEELKPIIARGSPSIHNLHIYKTVVPDARYVIGADPAEGNPNSDDSSLCVVDIESGEECATLSVKVEPDVFASYLVQVSTYYNYAPAMVERNNHGHSVIQWLKEHGRRVRLLLGHDADNLKRGKKDREKRKRVKPGWLSSTLGKTILYTVCTEFIRKSANIDDPERGSLKVIHNLKTSMQLADIESSTLLAPRGRNDDCADSFALAQVGRKQILDSGSTAVTVATGAKGWGM